MSMLDSFFNKGFKAAKCKTLLKLTIPRIKLLRNRREIQLKQMRREIAKLLETGQEATARIRVEHIIREENMMAAQEIVELFCELIAVRLPVIESQREYPLDLKEAISSVCFAAPRCADLPELLHVQILFASKYGKEFVSAATELMPDCGVNRQLIELLSIRAPSPEKKLGLLKEIAEEHEVDWDPAASETEFFKSHEDLLNGPTQFVSGSKLPLPEEKHDEKSHAAVDEKHNEQINSDTDLDELDFPEVPKVTLRPSANTASAPAVAPPLPTVSFSENDQGSSPSSGAVDNPSMRRHFESEQEEIRPVTSKDENPYASVSESKQFVPFISPPTLSSKSITMKPIEEPSYLSSRKSEANVDLQDVLAAAHAAAETAEKAASAARTAASLAQVRISELTKKNFDQAPENSSENPFHKDTCNESDAREKPYVGYYHSIGLSESHQVLKEGQGSQVSNLPTCYSLKESDIPLPDDSVIESNPDHHRPQRLTSMDDDYFSYPNLFTSQNSDTGSGAQSFIDKPNNNQDH